VVAITQEQPIAKLDHREVRRAGADNECHRTCDRAKVDLNSLYPQVRAERADGDSVPVRIRRDFDRNGLRLARDAQLQQLIGALRSPGNPGIEIVGDD
jgi:hypothetical protein